MEVVAATNPRTVVRAGLLVGLVLVFAERGTGFLSAGNLYSLAQSFALLGLVTIGLSLTMIVAEFDLSVGAMAALAGIIAIKTGAHPFLGVLVAVAAGAAVGFLNGVLVTRLKLSSLVVTVGTLILLTGLAYELTNGKIVSYTNLDVGLSLDNAYLRIFSPRWAVTAGIIVVVGLVLRFTRPGRDIYATGSARTAAEAAGVRVNHVILMTFVVSGACAALAGALLSFSLATGSPSFSGDLLLTSATAAIIGGVTLTGGTGTGGGIVTGILILAVLRNGLGLVGASDAVMSISTGSILLAVVLLDTNRVDTFRELADQLRDRARFLRTGGRLST